MIHLLKGRFFVDLLPREFGLVVINVKHEKSKIRIGNPNKLGVFDGLPVEPIRSEECVQNLANCLGIERGMLVPDKNGKLKIVINGWIKK